MIQLYCFIVKFVLALLKRIIHDSKLYFFSVMTNDEIIKMIKGRKEILDINQEYLAELSEVGLATLKRFESGKGNITLNNLQKIADVLGLEIKLDLKKPNK